MAAYVVVEVETHDAATMARYRELAAPVVAARGGRYLVRGGAITPLEGDWSPERFVILEFPGVEAARAWWECSEYAEAKALRLAAGKTRMFIVEGLASS